MMRLDVSRWALVLLVGLTFTSWLEAESAPSSGGVTPKGPAAFVESTRDGKRSPDASDTSTAGPERQTKSAPAPAPSPAVVTPNRTLSTSAPEQPAAPPAAPTRKEKTKVDVAFLLDTTSSMGGLIEGAKAKIWSIANKIVSGKPTPEVRIGLIAYRDRGDAYVTEDYDLTADIDAVYSKLKLFRAQGGGDTPEHVNQALSDAITNMSWSDDPKALKLVFLVGDAPPHDDYGGGLNSIELSEEAGRKGIRINTLRCGADPLTETAWQNIAKAAGGQYASIPQSGGVVVVATPFDVELARLNTELTKTSIGFGKAEAQASVSAKARAGMALEAPAAAERAAFSVHASSEQAFGGADLIGAVKEGRVDLDKIDREELPGELKERSKEELKAHVEAVAKKRQEIGHSIRELALKREEFLRQAASKNGPDSFDERVTAMIAEQAKEKGITYK